MYYDDPLTALNRAIFDMVLAVVYEMDKIRGEINMLNRIVHK